MSGILRDRNGDVVDAELNPLMAYFLGCSDWGPNDWYEIMTAKQRYAFPLLTHRAVMKLAQFSAGILEIGAGTGYWAEQIERLTGVHVEAYDISPLAFRRFRPRADEENGWHLTHKGFFQVGRGDENEVRDWPGYTLVLMFPPKEEEFPLGYNALRLYTGEYFVYVGEPEFLQPGLIIGFDSDGVKHSVEGTRGRTGTPAFHQELRDKWELVEEELLPNWPDLHASMFIYRRKQ